ncbi:zinc ribbon domain-containing protein [Bifidobacterium leontopitheci]|uniref:Zinc-ribbon domain-containing protein n=1 Tax=Bifidobacterium leontopitheci TaxID=2650774 RepID=A0A6I1GE67_9BIFI|nr:zinc ribbon domain-containing protein [Bifidobacterium leontopitheci]KAB7789920.1 zinc-ribbon domain-containing protein [Bifidobacterium leontopitheci]
MQCSRCGAQIGDGDRFCMNCGAPADAGAGAAGAGAAAAQVVCPSCGQPVDGTMRFCMNCGAPLAAGPVAAPGATGVATAGPAGAASGIAAGATPGASQVPYGYGVGGYPTSDGTTQPGTAGAAPAAYAGASGGQAYAAGAYGPLGDRTQVDANGVPVGATVTAPGYAAMPGVAGIPAGAPVAGTSGASGLNGAYGANGVAGVPSVAGTNGVPGAGAAAPDAAAAKPRSSKTPLIIGIVIAVVVVLAAAGFSVWWFLLRDSGDTAAGNPATSSQSSVKSKSGKSDGGTSGSKKTTKTAKPCTTAPDATLEAADRSGTSLIATLDLTSNCETGSAKTATFKESGVKVSIKDGDGDVFAAAVFDFSKQPIEFDGDTANVKLAFTTKQYWRPYDQIETGSSEVVMQTDQTGSGEDSADAGDALGGANIADSDIERYAQTALSWQLDHDKDAASGFYTTYTTQLSSKKYGMQAEGKTWRYEDIYEQFLQRRAKHGKALLVWSGDYPTYTKGGKTSDYYVILSGESFGSVDAGDAWCRKAGYGEADCLVVDLQ